MQKLKEVQQIEILGLLFGKKALGVHAGSDRDCSGSFGSTEFGCCWRSRREVCDRDVPEMIQVEEDHDVSCHLPKYS